MPVPWKPRSRKCASVRTCATRAIPVAHVATARTAVAALFPAGKVFPEGVVGRSLGSMNLVVVAAKGEVLSTYQHHFIDVPTGALAGDAGLKGLFAGKRAPTERFFMTDKEFPWVFLRNSNERPVTEYW